MSSMFSNLPEGLLPKWLLFISAVSLGNSIQAFTSLGPTQKVYSGPSATSTLSGAKPPAGLPPSTITSTSPVNPLSARTFGTWTFITAIVRLYAAYYLEERPMYQLAFWTFGVAWAHFMSEWWVFKSTKWSSGLAAPVVVSTSSMIWMWLQWDFYVKN
ncbi:hypothetical protein MBLNU459_g6207t1 [Dothideomycetes sp. NU459]